LLSASTQKTNSSFRAASQSAYGPYTAKAGTCKKTCKSLGKIAGWQDVTKGSESQLLLAVNINPVSVAIQADQSGFQFYKSGVFSGTCGTNLNHAAVLVGYGTQGTQDCKSALSLLANAQEFRVLQTGSSRTRGELLGASKATSG